MELTHEQGARFLAHHYVESRPSVQTGRIDALAESVTRDRVVVFDWETVELKAAALRDWLGY